MPPKKREYTVLYWPPTEHVCPTPAGMLAGTIIECNECHRVYEFIDYPRPQWKEKP